MELVKQPDGSNLCGQACVAMLINCCIGTAQIAINKKGKTYLSDLTRVLKNYYSFPDRLVRVRKDTEFPALALMKVRWFDKRSHWVVLSYGEVFDPSVWYPWPLRTYKAAINGRITSYLELKKLP